ncbi:hypothetical protein Tco_0375735, partial [Tanacetum coccineum]
MAKKYGPSVIRKRDTSWSASPTCPILPGSLCLGELRRQNMEKRFRDSEQREEEITTSYLEKDTIKTRNLGPDRVKEARLQTLITEFENLKMLDNDTIDAYAAKLSSIGSLEQVLDLKTTRFEDVVGRLKAYEERVKQEDKANNSQDKLLYARTDYSSRNSNSSRGRGHGSYPRGCSRGRGQRRGQGNSQNQDRKRDYEANLSEIHEGDVNHKEGTFFMMDHIQETIFMNEEKYTPPKSESNTDEDDVWYFNNGTSNHMTEDIDSESVHMVAVSKVSMLKSGEVEIWRMRIEQYIQMIDYALWEVIENGNT